MAASLDFRCSAKPTRYSGKRPPSGELSGCQNEAMPISFADKLARIPHYEAGTTSVEAAGREAAGDVAQLASNESPYAPVAEVVEVLQRAAAQVNRYPDPSARALKLGLSKRYDFDPGRIAVGNGSCE